MTPSIPPDATVDEALTRLRADLASARGAENDRIAVRADDLRILAGRLDFGGEEIPESDRVTIDAAVDESRQRGGSHAVIPIDALAVLIGVLHRSKAA